MPKHASITRGEAIFFGINRRGQDSRDIQIKISVPGLQFLLFFERFRELIELCLHHLDQSRMVNVIANYVNQSMYKLHGGQTRVVKSDCLANTGYAWSTLRFMAWYYLEDGTVRTT